jgi:hypothetical protein
VTGPTQPARRRWALTLTSHAPGAPTGPAAVVVASYWTHRGAQRALNRRNRIYPHAAYAIAPADWARYRDRAATLTALLATGGMSVAGLAMRTPMTRACVEHTLLRMARDGHVRHVNPADDPSTITSPRAGVWKLRTVQERTCDPS